MRAGKEGSRCFVFSAGRNCENISAAFVVGQMPRDEKSPHLTLLAPFINKQVLK